MQKTAPAPILSIMSDTARDYQIIEPVSTEGLEDLFKPLTTPGQANPDQGLTTPNHPYTYESPELVFELRQQIADLKMELDTKLAEAQREIQGAAYRNGYLESQLEIEREQVKLLTDSQHKAGWWHRLSSWFIGR